MAYNGQWYSDDEYPQQPENDRVHVRIVKTIAGMALLIGAIVWATR